MTATHRTRAKMYQPGPVVPTRYRELAYQHRGDHWRLLDVGGAAPGVEPAGIGPQYPTRGELLADLDRYAREVYGC